jgi:hypothetical protein
MTILFEKARLEPAKPLGGGGGGNVLNIALMNTRNGREIVGLNWTYTELSEMNTWNLYLINQAMANAPIVKLLPDAELTGVMEGNWNPAPPPEEEPHATAFYAGLISNCAMGDRGLITSIFLNCIATCSLNLVRSGRR